MFALLMMIVLASVVIGEMAIALGLSVLHGCSITAFLVVGAGLISYEVLRESRRGARFNGKR